MVLLPVSALTGLGADHLEALLAHELAHIRRYDAVANLFQTLVETLLFYHPAVWWVSRQVRIERESCCDELAVELCGNRLLFARALASMEGLRPLSPHATLAANGGPLMIRIRRLVTGESKETPGAAWLAGALGLALLVAGVVVPLEGASSPEDVLLLPSPSVEPAAAAESSARAPRAAVPEHSIPSKAPSKARGGCAPSERDESRWSSGRDATGETGRAHSASPDPDWMSLPKVPMGE